VQHIAQPRLSLRRTSRRRGHAAPAPPPPLAGDRSGQAAIATRSRVRPITTLWYLFASPGPHRRRRASPVAEGTSVKVFVLEGLVLRNEGSFVKSKTFQGWL
jgi:hypothetical protein